MKSKEGFTLSGVTLTESGIQVTTGVFANVTAIECVEDGQLKITWPRGSNMTYSFVAGMANPIHCASVEVVSGKFNISQVD